MQITVYLDTKEAVGFFLPLQKKTPLSLSRKATNSSASQRNSLIKICCNVHKTPSQLVRILSLIEQIHVFRHYSLKIHFNIILKSSPTIIVISFSITAAITLHYLHLPCELHDPHI